MLKSRLCDYNDGCILVKGAITIVEHIEEMKQKHSKQQLQLQIETMNEYYLKCISEIIHN